MRMFSTVRARSVAGLKATGDPWIIVLDPNDADAYKHNGTPVLTADCGMSAGYTTSAATTTAFGGSGFAARGVVPGPP